MFVLIIHLISWGEKSVVSKWVVSGDREVKGKRGGVYLINNY